MFVFLFRKRVHKGERNLTCEDCNKGFGTQHELRIHAQSQHTKLAQPVECTKCPEGDRPRFEDKYSYRVGGHFPVLYVVLVVVDFED